MSLAGAPAFPHLAIATGFAVGAAFAPKMEEILCKRCRIETLFVGDTVLEVNALFDAHLQAMAANIYTAAAHGVGPRADGQLPHIFRA